MSSDREYANLFVGKLANRLMHYSPADLSFTPAAKAQQIIDQYNYEASLIESVWTTFFAVSLARLLGYGSIDSFASLLFNKSKQTSTNHFCFVCYWSDHYEQDKIMIIAADQEDELVNTLNKIQTLRAFL